MNEYISEYALTEYSHQADRYLCYDPSIAISESVELPEWQGKVYLKIYTLLQLENNWDSYGAKSISISAAKSMFSVLLALMYESTPAPTLVPTPDGTLQAEWHLKGIDLEIEVISDSVIDVYFEDQNGELPKLDEKLNVDLTKLGEHINLLTSRKN